jgi:hypothetical protein
VAFIILTGSLQARLYQPWQVMSVIVITAAILWFLVNKSGLVVAGVTPRGEVRFNAADDLLTRTMSRITGPQRSYRSRFNVPRWAKQQKNKNKREKGKHRVTTTLDIDDKEGEKIS